MGYINAEERREARDIANCLGYLRNQLNSYWPLWQVTRSKAIDLVCAHSHLTKHRPVLEKEIVDAAKLEHSAVAGVYFLVANDCVVYVGQSVNVYTRIQQHKADKQFQSWTYIRCNPSELDALEAIYILLLRPPLNKAPSRIRWVEIVSLADKQLRDRHSILEYEIKYNRKAALADPPASPAPPEER